MNILFKNIGLIIHPKKNIKYIINEIISLLTNNNINIYIDRDYKDIFNQINHNKFNLINKNDLGKFCDLVISVGGDGTILTVARLLAPYNVPLVGVHEGNLGFLTQIPGNQTILQITKILSGQYIQENRILLSIEIVRDGKVMTEFLALNEVACTRGSRGNMITLEMFINKEFVFTQRADGIIVSTPTGSTAYALAAGGPILQPNIQALTIVPVCPQSMSQRPIVVDAFSKLELLITDGSDARVYFDGHASFDLVELDQIKIERYKNELIMLNPVNYRYFKTLRQKLHWGEQLI